MATRDSTSWMPPLEGKVPCSIGVSLSRHFDARQGKQVPKRKAGIPDRDFFAFRYNLKPPSVDDSKEGVFHRNKLGDNTTIQVQLPSSKSNDMHYFSGKEIPAKEVDCILIYDEDTGTLIIEKLEACMSLQHERKPPVSALAAPSSEHRPVKPLPTSRPATTKEEEEEDDGDVPLAVVLEQSKKTRPVPVKAVASKPTKKSTKRAAVAPEPDLISTPKATKRARLSSPLPKPSPQPRAPEPVLALPGTSTTYAAPLTVDGLPSMTSTLSPSLPPQAEEEEDDDEWDEVSPQVIPPPVSVEELEPSLSTGNWVMEEDFGEPSSIGGEPPVTADLDDDFDEALFGAELEKSLMELDQPDQDADGDADEEDDFLIAAVSPVIETTALDDGVDGPMSFHQLHGGDIGGSDDEDTDTSSDGSEDD